MGDPGPKISVFDCLEEAKPSRPVFSFLATGFWDHFLLILVFFMGDLGHTISVFDRLGERPSAPSPVFRTWGMFQVFCDVLTDTTSCA